jgi:hypothetical protein
VCSIACACGGGSASEPAPTAALASSRAAQEAFRPLKQRFATSDVAGRAALEPSLTRFVATYPQDGLAPLARLYLGLIAVERGDAAAARQVAEGVAAGQSGTTRDLAELLDGAILLRQKATAQALERFMPLVGKLIDPYARMLLDEYIVSAAIGARRWYEAVAYMDLWLRDATEDSAAMARAEVRKSLATIPIDALELMLQAMQGNEARTGYGVEIKRELVARLASVALEKQDTGLARRLVESTTSSLALGEAAEGLEELASSGGAATVDGRTIGLLVSAGQSPLGGRAAEALAGVVDALRLAGDASDHVRLTTRDERDPKRTELALLALASQGASILVAGLDPAQADIAAKFAERTRVPVILLSALSREPSPDAPVFVLGEAADPVALALADALASHGARTVAAVGGAAQDTNSAGGPAAGKLAFVGAVPCSAQPSQAGASPFPVESWRAARVDALILLGDAACASDAIATVAGQKLGPLRVAVGLDGAEIAADPNRLPLLVAGAGIFPLRRGDSASAMYGFSKRHGRSPSFFAALGHDAAVLARAAEKTLPTDRTEDPSEVERRHRAAAAALLRAEGDLWTTSARGFASQSVIARDISLLEVK